MVLSNGFETSLGLLLNYEALAQFLTRLPLPNHARFLDLACGSGVLLKALADCNHWRSTVGVEIDPRVAERAREVAVGSRIVTGDVFDARTLSAIVTGVRTFCHSGYSFLNAHSAAQRGVLLDVLTSISEIVAFGFEIQNPAHQARFEFGRWYHRALRDGTTLRTRSMPLSDDSFKLQMQFGSKASRRTVTETLYVWPLEECLAAGEARGWNTYVMDADYRDVISDVSSHLFILFQRH